MQRELGDVIRQLLEIFGTILLVGEKPLDNGLGVTVMQALPDDAELAETHLFVSGPWTQKFPDDGAQPLLQGTDDIGHQGIQGHGGLDHFPGHELKAMGTQIIGKKLENSVLDKDAQAAGSREGLIFGAVQGIFLQGPAVGVLEDGGIEPFFIAKMVIDRGKVGPGPAADFPDRGLAEAAGGKDFTGGQQEALAGFRSGGGRRDLQFPVFRFPVFR